MPAVLMQLQSARCISELSAESEVSFVEDTAAFDLIEKVRRLPIQRRNKRGNDIFGVY